VMNLVSLLILPAVITLRHNGARYAIAGAALVVLLAAIAFSKRKSDGVGGGDLPPAVQIPEPAAPVAALD